MKECGWISCFLESREQHGREYFETQIFGHALRFTSRVLINIMRALSRYGGIAQLGERLHGMQEVSGSIPLISTKRASKFKSPSSRGLGHRPFTAVTRVRISLGTPQIPQFGQVFCNEYSSPGWNSLIPDGQSGRVEFLSGRLDRPRRFLRQSLLVSTQGHLQKMNYPAPRARGIGKT